MPNTFSEIDVVKANTPAVEYRLWTQPRQLRSAEFLGYVREELGSHYFLPSNDCVPLRLLRSEVLKEIAELIVLLNRDEANQEATKEPAPCT